MTLYWAWVRVTILALAAAVVENSGVIVDESALADRPVLAAAAGGGFALAAVAEKLALIAADTLLVFDIMIKWIVDSDKVLG